jgi:GLPGLI family protein
MKLRNPILLFCCVVFTITNYSQEKIVQVLYKVKDIDKSTNIEKIPANLKQTYLDVKQLAEKHSFLLTFDKNKSNFIKKPMMNLSERDKNLNALASVQFTVSQDYYYDFEKNILVTREFDGTLVKQKYQKMGWNITSESKTIGGYLCYKANFSIPIISKGKEYFRKGYVWFTPSLPFSVGPKEYTGLPGLVIEVHEEYIVYYADKINLNSAQKVVFPKGKTITKAEYEKKLSAQIGM